MNRDELHNDIFPIEFSVSFAVSKKQKTNHSENVSISFEKNPAPNLFKQKNKKTYFANKMSINMRLQG